ncbi:hypothetical protein CIK05_09150 [Bdellovibrio sp. qaytius]|nr:hypothetical protein CIK05_09150 [Bdellovibrio sp. qaytius]
MKNFLFLLTLVFSLSAFSAALCPPSSCNPHNGCMEGCSVKTAYGKALCNQDDPKLAEKEAISKGVTYASQSCFYSFFYNSKWDVQTVNNNNVCEVVATASISCMQ